MPLINVNGFNISRYTLSAEVYPGGRKVSRIHFGHLNSSSSPPYESTRTVAVLSRESLTGCFLETAYLRAGVSDLTTPVTFRLELQLEQDGPPGGRTSYGDRSRTIPNINQFPILEKAGATKQLTVPFQKWCGEDDICNSQLGVTLAISPGFDPLTRRLEIATRSEVRLTLDVSNTGEPAYAAVLEVSIDPAFDYVGRSDNVTAISCEYKEREVSKQEDFLVLLLLLLS